LIPHREYSLVCIQENGKTLFKKFSGENFVFGIAVSIDGAILKSSFGIPPKYIGDRNMNLKDTVEAATWYAYEEDAIQIVGKINGEWRIAHYEDCATQSQMRGPQFELDATTFVYKEDEAEYEALLAAGE
jgi:hypothetical protein